jgi:transposase
MQLNLKTILNLKEHHRHFVYHDVRLTHPTGITAPRIEVTIEPRQGSKGICSGCGKTCAGYDRLPERRFIHVPLWGIAVIFLYCMRRPACSTCGVTVEVVPWSSGKGPITLSYGWYLSEWAKVLSMQEVARQFKASWHHVFLAVTMAVAWGRERMDAQKIIPLPSRCTILSIPNLSAPFPTASTTSTTTLVGSASARITILHASPSILFAVGGVMGKKRYHKLNV